MSRPRIVVTGRIPDAGLELLRDAGDVWAWDDDEPIPAAVRDEQLVDADAAVTLLTDRVDDAFLDAAPSIRVVANVAVGYNNIDVDACRRRGVTVTNTPGVLTDATADLAIALVLMATRRLGEGERLVRSGEPWQWGMFMMLGRSIDGRRLGLVGMGAIGQAVARRASAFGMEVVYHNRSRVDAALERSLGVSYLPLEELLASSDVVSLHCPYTSETHHLIDAAALERMADDAVLVNTARGPVVDEAALVTALRSGTIAAAGLDVYEGEP
ncbi:gyaR, partial [Symbiodinium sp. KB8]